MSALQVLTNPEQFFERASDDPRLLPPTAVSVVAAVFSALSVWPFIQALNRGLQADAGAASSIITTTSLVGGLLGPLLLWVILTALFHAISAVFFGGSGEFTTTLAFVGWGNIPAIFSGAFGAAVNYYVYSDLTVPSISDPQKIHHFTQQLRAQPEFQVLTLVGVAFVVWQAFIWTYAIEHARNVTLREAAITVGVPTVLWIAWQLHTLL